MIDDEDDKPDIMVGPRRSRTLVTDIVDPFTTSGENLRKADGLDQNTRRRQTNKIKKVYTGQEGSGSKREETESQVDGYNLFEVVLPKYNLDYLAKIYEMSAPHAAAVQAKVANIAGLGYDFVEAHAVRRKFADADDAKRDRMRKQLNNIKEQMYGWLDNCNDEDTFTETLMKVWTDYETTGNGYLEIGRTFNGEIGYIGHIPSSTMRIRKRRDGYVQMVANSVKFFRNFGDRLTFDPIGNDPQPNEIIHLKKYSPTSQFYGVPDIISAQQAIAGNEFAARFNLDYFENKAVPRYVIVVKGGSFSQQGQQSLLEFFETGLKGQNHRTIFVPLPADSQDAKTSFEMKPVEAGAQDSSFPNYRKGNLADILMAHRVPITKVTIPEGVSLAAARDLDKTFKEQVCRPAQKVFEKKIARIINEKTDIFNLKLNELSLTDEDTQSKIDERDLRLGKTTVNEIRAREGKSPLPWGDERPETAGTAMGKDQKEINVKTLAIQEKTAQQVRVATGSNPAANEARAQATGNRQRDQDRSSNASDTSGEGRATQGNGRTQS